MVGIAKKNENSVAAFRDNPANIPPTIVAPERDVPGIIATHCTNPTIKACLKVMAVASVVLCSNCLDSTQNIIKPPIINAIATTNGLKRTCLIKSTARTPITTAGIKAIMTLIAKCLASGSPLKKPFIKSNIFFRYNQHTANIAPS